MPYYEEHTATTIQQFLTDLAAFATANGWTVDYLGVHATTELRLHMHKGSLHIDGFTYYSTAAQFYHCTGYVFGSNPSAQPGVGQGAGSITITVGEKYSFYSTVGGIFYEIRSSATANTWGMLFHLQAKIGAFADGFGAVWPGNNGLFIAANPNGNIYVNGAWGGINITAGALSCIPVYPGLGALGPNMYNAAIVPFPLLMGMIHATDITKHVPLGFAPGVYSCNGTGIYSNGDSIIIGADTYLISAVSGNPDSDIHTGHYLFKLGA
ncbi:MAG: hypothetical protein J0652_02580 [Desulfobulbaceae bacterium]|nr:hypothetical protein [Desulfobulbaceae bacterium]